jgi:glycosyltransferase involved in cell wall biosynthesis
VKVIQCVPAISNEAAGISYSVVRLCDAIVEAGVDLEMAGLDWAPLASPPAYFRPFPLGWGPARLGPSPSMRRWLRDQVENAQVDVLHAHAMWQFNTLYPGAAVRGTDVPLVTAPRGMWSQWAMASGSRAKKVFWPLLQRPAVARTACFHATSEAEYEDIRRLGFEQPVALIPNGIDLPELQEREESDVRTLLFLSRIHRVKGLEMLLEAWSNVHLRHPEWRLVIAGSDDGYYGTSGYLDEIKALTESLRVSRVEFVGEVRGTEKQRLYQDADLFVLPSHSENFGMVVAEALAAGTPAVVSRGAPWSQLEDEAAGWWVEIGTDPLTAALDEALATPREELEAMGKRGRAWMQRDFSWAELGRRTIQTYRWLLGNSGPAPEWVRTQ